MYGDVNSIYAQTQTLLDEQAGIHIRPQQPDFPAERVDQFTHSLIDPTVNNSIIKRRAKAGCETITKSYHDDCVKKNAQFRHDAGLKCYIVRMGTKCCEWCSEVAGKYEFGDQPDGIFRRHDNCDCTIIYDGQVLRGKKGADGRRSRSWEEVPNANADYIPNALSEADARAVEQRNLAQIRGLKINNSSIDNANNRGIMKLGINLFDTSDELYVEAFSIEEETGFTDIYLHGSPSSVQIKVNGKPKNLTPTEFEKLLKEKGLNGGDIRLCSCSTGYGDNSFAQQLSEIHSGRVKAPNDDVYYAPNEGTVFIGDPNSNVGEWRIFEKGVEIND